MMKCSKRQRVSVIVLAQLIFALTSTSAVNDEKPKVRFVATNDYDENVAIQNGCEVLRQYKRFKVFLCEEKIGEKLKLEKDIRVYVLDIDMDRLVGADTAWEAGYTGKGVKIATIDTGIDYTHPELVSSYINGHDVVNGDNDPMDDNGHGTLIAGVITSDGIDQRSKGIAPDAGIVAIKTMDQYGSGSLADIADAIYSAVDDYEVDVISISIGSGVLFTNYCDERSTITRLTRDAINYAHANGVNVVVGAGNAEGPMMFPGCLSNAFSIGAVDSNFDISFFSSRGFMVDLYAPGEEIYSTTLDDKYETAWGTSLSTPFVSGAIALLREKNSKLDYDIYENALTNGSTENNTPIGMIKILNVSGALENIEAPVVCDAPKLSSSYRNGKVVVSWESKTGRSYSLEERDSLFFGGWTWIRQFDGTGSTIEYVADPAGAMKFYRLSIITE